MGEGRGAVSAWHPLMAAIHIYAVCGDGGWHRPPLPPTHLPACLHSRRCCFAGEWVDKASPPPTLAGIMDAPWVDPDDADLTEAEKNQREQQQNKDRTWRSIESCDMCSSWGQVRSFQASNSRGDNLPGLLPQATLLLPASRAPPPPSPFPLPSTAHLSPIPELPPSVPPPHLSPMPAATAMRSPVPNAAPSSTAWANQPISRARERCVSASHASVLGAMTHYLWATA